MERGLILFPPFGRTKNVGVSVHGEVAWQRLNPALEISAEDGSEKTLTNLLAFSLLTA
jgi:hypothetical protein